MDAYTHDPDFDPTPVTVPHSGAYPDSPPSVPEPIRLAILAREIARVTADLRGQGLFDTPAPVDLLALKEIQYRREIESGAVDLGIAFINAWNAEIAAARLPVRSKVVKRTNRSQSPLIDVA